MNETHGIKGGQVKEGKSLLKKFMDFLAMGGFVVLLVLGVIIAVVIDNMLR
jgi:hypothetical protein